MKIINKQIIRHWTLDLGLWTLLLSAPVFGASVPPLSAEDRAVLKQIELLNNIPEAELNESVDPTLSVMRAIIDLDSPEYLRVRKLAAIPAVRGPLTPGARALLAELISPRWDAYNIAGSLWLAALRTPNTDLRSKAQKKFLQFVEGVHVPELIRLLSDPIARNPAHDILKEITGQSFSPDPKVWNAWLTKRKGALDIVGVLIQETRVQVSAHPIPAFDHDRLWYVPDGVRDKALSFKDRSPQEQELIQQWNNWADTQVHLYIDSWTQIKPALERITHHPDPRVNQYLETLLDDPAYGDYAAIVLAWRQSVDSLSALRTSYATYQTVARALARGSLGDTDALVNLLQMIDHSALRPLSYGIMEDEVRSRVSTLKSVGVLPAEEAFELLCHRNFGFASAETGKDKRKRFEKARTWLKTNARNLIFDSRRGYFTVVKSKG